MDWGLLFLIPVAVLGGFGLMAWLAMLGRLPAEDAPGAMVLKHSWWTRGFAIFSAFVIPLGITVLMFFQPPKDNGDVAAIIGIYALFAFLAAPLLWESLRFRLVADDEGLACRSPWRGTEYVAWDELEEVSYSLGNAWYVLHAIDGYKFRVHKLVPGAALRGGVCAAVAGRRADAGGLAASATRPFAAAR